YRVQDHGNSVSNLWLTFTIVSYLTGVFVFATIVGQVGNIITTRNADRIEFEKILDHAKSYMRANSVDKDLQSRILRWYDYAWSKGCGGGGQDINTIGLLPDKLKTELALNVNLETLKKVTIFHECRPEFLHDIVLKMRPLVFTPGDLICRKGEIAREIFIIADGVLEVLSESNEVISRMSAGDFFGEIGVLNIDGVNKRTADVRAVGYTELFVLSREDILKALKDHPEAEVVIRKHATRRLCETRVRQQAHLYRKKSQTLSSDNLCKSYNLSGKLPENTSVKLEIPPMITTHNMSEVFVDNENNTQDQLSTINSDIFTQWKLKNFKGKNETNRLAETLDQFAERWETILMNITQHYREEIGVLREQILQFSSANIN
ncbi:Cyclic nucleotide-gated cation channel alpha-3, partial [Schistosoma japonicum]